MIPVAQLSREQLKDVASSCGVRNAHRLDSPTIARMIRAEGVFHVEPWKDGSTYYLYGYDKKPWVKAEETHGFPP